MMADFANLALVPTSAWDDELFAGLAQWVQRFCNPTAGVKMPDPALDHNVLTGRKFFRREHRTSSGCVRGHPSRSEERRNGWKVSAPR